MQIPSCFYLCPVRPEECQKKDRSIDRQVKYHISVIGLIIEQAESSRYLQAYLLLQHGIELLDNVTGLKEDGGHWVQHELEMPLLGHSDQDVHIDVHKHRHGLLQRVILELVHSIGQALSAVDLAKNEDDLQ